MAVEDRNAPSAQRPFALGAVAHLLPFARVHPGESMRSPSIQGIATHTQDVLPGFLFACIPGTTGDGHAFAPRAVQSGAIALLVERFLPSCVDTVQFEVPDSRKAVGIIARAFYGNPDRRLHLVAVTGTNGKTTTAFLLEAIYRAAGMPMGMLGTVEYRLGQRTIAASLTTPDAVHLASYLAEMASCGMQGAVLEASSHALAQDRLTGLEIDTAIFTNLARDHWDYHGGLLPYFAAKRRLFAPRGGSKPYPPLAVISVDQWAGRLLARQVAEQRQVVTYGLRTPADFTATTCPLPSGSLLIVRHGEQVWPFVLPLHGDHNAQNALAAAAAALSVGIAAEAIAKGLAAVRSIPGRMESIDCGQPFTVLVDFAHNPAGLLEALRAARGRKPERLILVFGCKGADGDTVKRHLMGRIAAQGADMVWLTTDDPYEEDPERIAEEVARGLQGIGHFRIVLDRQQAIAEAIQSAEPGDTVLVAGRGHEVRQPTPEGQRPLDDREVCRAAIQEWLIRSSARIPLPSPSASGG